MLPYNMCVSTSFRSESDDDIRPTFSQILDRDVAAVPPKKRMKGAWMASSATESSNNIVSQLSGDEFDSPEDFIKKSATAGSVGSSYSGLGMKLMKNMGFKEGTGLGKLGQGRKEIIEESKHKGRRGLGHSASGFDRTDDAWDSEKEVVSSEELVEWMESYNKPIPNVEELKGWMEIGKTKRTIDDECEFCSQKMVDDVLKYKSVFDNLEDEELRKARTRANPFEIIRNGIFQNRAAMKMANMDSVFDFMFTSPVDTDGRSLIEADELLYFADMCAGPGGFSEYILWRKPVGDAKGFGFTLKGGNDFKLENFLAAPSQFFEPHYGENGVEGDGDIYRPGNLQAFRQFVMMSTNGKGVHFAMADGGFSVSGKENIQEILSKRLYLCQFLCALSIIRTGGHFVCKLFDLFTPFSVGLVYLMNMAFEQVSIFKPVTSRPANSERYIVCKWRKEEAEFVHDYLFHVNEEMDRLGSCSAFEGPQDVNHVVPLEVMKEDSAFFNYIYDSNMVLGKQQIVALFKIQTFARNENLIETDVQLQMKDECLKKWQVPDEARMEPVKNDDPAHKFTSLVKGASTGDVLLEPTILELSNLKEKIHSVYDYRCMVTGSSDRKVILSLGKRKVFQWNGEAGSKWTPVQELAIDLPSDTSLLVEVVNEYRGEGTGQRKITALHVLDALVLYKKDTSTLHFRERMNKLKKFVLALQRPTRSDLTPIRVKEVFPLKNLQQIFDSLEEKRFKRKREQHMCYCPASSNDGVVPYFIPTGLLFFRLYQNPWTTAFSRTKNRIYFFNTKTNDSHFDLPTSLHSHVLASFRSCQLSVLWWVWGPDDPVLPNIENTTGDKLSGKHLMNLVETALKRER